MSLRRKRDHASGRRHFSPRSCKERNRWAGVGSAYRSGHRSKHRGHCIRLLCDTSKHAMSSHGPTTSLHFYSPMAPASRSASMRASS